LRSESKTGEAQLTRLASRRCVSHLSRGSKNAHVGRFVSGPQSRVLKRSFPLLGCHRDGWHRGWWNGADEIDRWGDEALAGKQGQLTHRSAN
jgi:hypothetical protein